MLRLQLSEFRKNKITFFLGKYLVLFYTSRTKNAGYNKSKFLCLKCKFTSHTFHHTFHHTFTYIFIPSNLPNIIGISSEFVVPEGLQRPSVGMYKKVRPFAAYCVRPSSPNN
jgi:hypothetical protein